MVNQKNMIINHIAEFGSITPIDAENKYGIMRLASRISDLKKDGYIISRDIEKGKNRFGESCVYARYTIVGRKGNALDQ